MSDTLEITLFVYVPPVDTVGAIGLNGVKDKGSTKLEVAQRCVYI